MTPEQIEKIAKTRKIALHLPILYGGATPCIMEVRFVDYDEHYQPLPEGTLREDTLSGYVRISNIIEVSGFAALSNDDVMRNAVATLNEAEREAYEELNKKLAQIKERKQALLTLSHHPSEESAANGG